MQAVSLPAEPPGEPKNTAVGSLSLLQWIFPTQESNWGLLHCRQILYQPSNQGSLCVYISTYTHTPKCNHHLNQETDPSSSFQSLLSILIFFCYVKNQFSALKQDTLMTSTSIGQESGCGLARSSAWVTGENQGVTQCLGLICDLSSFILCWNSVPYGSITEVPSFLLVVGRIPVSAPTGRPRFLPCGFHPVNPVAFFQSSSSWSL